MFTSMCLAVASLLAAPQQDRDDQIKRELENLTGTWEIVYLEVDGKEIPRQDFKDFRRIQLGDRVIWKRGDQTEFEIKFAIDPRANPKTVDSTYETGENKGKTHLAIYQLDGDDFTMCFGLFDKPRPTQFATTPDSGQVLYKARRISR